MDAFNHTAFMCFPSHETPHFTVIDIQGVVQVVALTIFVPTLIDYSKARGPELVAHAYRHAKGMMQDIPISLLASMLQNQKERQWGVNH